MLNKHHQNSKLFYCSICFHGFSRKYNLQRHEETHKEVRMVYSCKLCPKVYPHKDKLKQHEKIVHHNLSLINNIPATGSLFQVFRCHISVRGGENRRMIDIQVYDYYLLVNVVRPKLSFIYVTQEININFSGSLYFFSNEPGSSSEKMYCCAKCPAVFNRKYNLRRHAEQHKDIKELHACSICNKTFSRKDSLKLHEKLLHGLMQDFLNT
ncbi:Zinc finger protein 337 like protein [Argiope bruennichi]|uniref:Zinc finger protein 337 like protein n=1 Tax=Argiope bruennichi TaxID=94029 RepID=A0A8T0EBW0_ARGBR|nr:Zinc finger protein 337 like protein [Argiope bruennichi]